MKINLTKTDWYLIIIFYVIAIPVTFSGYDYSKGLFHPTFDTIIYCIFSFCVTYVVVFNFFPRYFPESKILTLFLWTCIFMTVVGVIEIFLYEMASLNFKNINFAKILQALKDPELWFGGLSTSSQNAGILIGVLLGKKFYDAQIDIQKREKEKKESELRFLKSQLDPHFLFNNLNTVDSLIDSNPETAKIYVNRLSNLYRYLTRTKDDEVVPLVEELKFVKDYIYLMQQRYGAAFGFQIINDIDISDSLIPPGALQTLLENVIKHNNGNENHPITTTININKETISVRNNIKLKKSITDSYGVGLSNLIARYNLLSDQKVEIKQGSFYEVILPNLKSVSE